MLAREAENDQQADGIDCDVLVIGSGAGGLSAAVTAAESGLSVCVVEKALVLGGTSAWSGGWMWIPRNPLAREAGVEESAQAARDYLIEELGGDFEPERIDAFLAHGPEMVAFFRQHSALRFVDGNRIPDFHGAQPHAGLGGRSVCAAPYDGRRLGRHIELLRPPLDLHSLWGLGIASGADLAHFLKATRSFTSARHVARRVGRHAWDLCRYRRAMQLVGGNALVAALLESALARGVTLLPSHAVTALTYASDRVSGARVETPEGERRISARCGVILACGGFPHDRARQQSLFDHVSRGTPHYSAAPRTNTGDGLRLGEDVGARVIDNPVANAAWAPVSLVPRRDGTTGHFPHLIERGKPGLIAVTRSGQRFANEAGAYHDMMRSLFDAVPENEPIEAWLICDHRFQRRYGLGISPPAPLPVGSWVRRGYLKRAESLAALAEACGIHQPAFVASVDAYNRDARRGEDPAFGRGSTPYNRIQGDSACQPNPCVAPIEHGPFYAVRIVPGSLGTFAGLATDAHARVLDHHEMPIPGLYAAGNDMASVMAGRYPAGGITLGPAMTFGYIAARQLAVIADASPRQEPASSTVTAEERQTREVDNEAHPST